MKTIPEKTIYVICLEIPMFEEKIYKIGQTVDEMFDNLIKEIKRQQADPLIPFVQAFQNEEGDANPHKIEYQEIICSNGKLEIHRPNNTIDYLDVNITIQEIELQTKANSEDIYLASLNIKTYEDNEIQRQDEWLFAADTLEDIKMQIDTIENKLSEIPNINIKEEDLSDFVSNFNNLDLQMSPYNIDFEEKISVINGEITNSTSNKTTLLQIRTSKEK